MGFLKNLFVGVYAANGGTRMLFLPLCYILLISPFMLGFVHLYQVNILAFVPSDYTAADILPQLFVFLITVSLFTRVFSGIRKDERKGKVKNYPYWLPGIRHWGSFVFGGDGWLKRVRSVEPCIQQQNY